MKLQSSKVKHIRLYHSFLFGNISAVGLAILLSACDARQQISLCFCLRALRHMLCFLMYIEEPTFRSPISKDLSQNVKGKYQDIAGEVEILKSLPTNVASDESETTHEHATAFETRKIEDEKDITEESQSAKHSPPTKQVSSLKNVRFKDDVQRGEEKQKRPESLPKQLSHSDGKVSDCFPVKPSKLYRV